MITYMSRISWYIWLVCAVLPNSAISIKSGESSSSHNLSSGLDTSLQPTCEPAAGPSVLAMPSLKPSNDVITTRTASMACPNGWKLIKINCYASLATAVPAKDCNNLCVQNMSHLPCIQDEDQNAYLAGLADAQQPNSSPWIDSEWSSGCVSSFNGVTDQVYPEGDLFVNSVGRWLPGQDLQQCVCQKDTTTSPNSNIIVFDYTGDEQKFIIPKGVLALKITIYGASGGPSTTPTCKSEKGATVTSTIVNPLAGSVLYINVGGKGRTGIHAGGFNGGGASSCAHSGSGGGATDVRYPTRTLVDRIMVAGGGRGAAGRQPCESGGGSDGVCIGGAGGSSESESSRWSLYEIDDAITEEGNIGNGYGILHLTYRTSVVKHSTQSRTTDARVMDFAQSTYFSQQDFTPEEIIPPLSFGWVSSVANYPSIDPTVAPSPPKSAPPSLEPTDGPSVAPTLTLTVTPTQQPSTDPSIDPTVVPSQAPSSVPSVSPTADPTVDPTESPSVSPTVDPTVDRTESPSVSPTADPTVDPTQPPSVFPTVDPTVDPTESPSVSPTADPTVDPTQPPSTWPTVDPSIAPTQMPSTDPSAAPTAEPTLEPTDHPSAGPTISPTADPSPVPSLTPFSLPSTAPTSGPSVEPYIQPSDTPTIYPSIAPSHAPSMEPTVEPTAAPTVMPTQLPTDRPTPPPTFAPSNQPTPLPSNTPTAVPSLNGWLRPEINATEYVGSFDNTGTVWTYILNNGTVSQLRSDSAGGTFAVRFQDASWTSITSVSRIEADGQLIISGSRLVDQTESSSVAHCRADTDPMVCTVKSLPDVTFLAESRNSFTNQDVYFGHSFGHVTATVFSKSFAEQSYTFESNFVQNWQFTHIVTPSKFAGSFVSGSAVGKDGRNYLIMGYFRADDGSLQPTYLKPTTSDILHNEELVNAMDCDPTTADLFIGGGLTLNGENVAVSAYLVRVNALYRTFLYGVRYVSTVGDRRVLSAVTSANGSHSIVQAVQLVDQTLYVLLNTNHTAQSERLSFATIIKAHAATGVIMKQVRFAVQNASARCTSLGATANSLIIACSSLAWQTEGVGETFKRSFLVSIDKNLTLSTLPAGFYLYGTDLFRTKNILFKATYFPATSQQATFRTVESAGGGTGAPVNAPTMRPTHSPSIRPSVRPSSAPSSRPSSSPTATPSVSPQPTSQPSTGGPTNTYKPTVKPSQRPSTAPSKPPTRTPTRQPTTAPTAPPMVHPTIHPTALPSVEPTIKPTRAPSVKSSRMPSTLSTHKPTAAPSVALTLSPTLSPTVKEQTVAGQTLAGTIVAYIFGSLAFLWGAHWLYQFCMRVRERYRIKAEIDLAFASIRQAVQDGPARSVHRSTQRLHGISQAASVAGAYVYGTRSAANTGDDSANGIPTNGAPSNGATAIGATANGATANVATANGVAVLPARGAYVDFIPVEAAPTCVPDSLLSICSDSDIYSVSSLYSSEMSDGAQYAPSTEVTHPRSWENDVEEGGGK